MNQIEQNMMRFKVPVMAGAAGIIAALVVATLPHAYLENIIGATGLSEIVPAAAPPLGNTARGLIALMAGLVSASAIYFFLNRKGGSDMGVALREQINAANPVTEDYDAAAKAKAEKKRFALPKLNTGSLTKFLKKPKKSKSRDQDGSKSDRNVMDLADLPKLRSADAHPDAPARRPIFAETDLGAPLPLEVKPFENEIAAQPVHVAPEQTETPDPAPTNEVRANQASANQPSPNDFVVEEPSAQPSETAEREQPQPAVDTYESDDTEDLSEWSIADLTDRLEAGLQHLKKLEAATLGLAATPAAPVQEQVMETAPAPQTAQAPAHQPLQQQVQPPMAEQSPPPLKEVEPTQEQVQATRQADMDAALKAALGTLEKMTAYR